MPEESPPQVGDTIDPLHGAVTDGRCDQPKKRTPWLFRATVTRPAEWPADSNWSGIVTSAAVSKSGDLLLAHHVEHRRWWFAAGTWTDYRSELVASDG